MCNLHLFPSCGYGRIVRKKEALKVQELDRGHTFNIKNGPPLPACDWQA